MTKITWNQEEIEAARLAIEDELVSRRDNCISVIKGNGLCIRWKDGSPSDIIRMTTSDAIVTALEAINKFRGVG